MITWGIVANSHDASLAVFNSPTKHEKGIGDPHTELLWAGLAKDFSGIPNDPHLNQELIEYASFFGPPDKIVWYERPFLKSIRQLKAGQGWLFKENNIKEYLRGYNLANIPISYTKHHLSHAAYAYYTQPHDDCAVICLDSIGEFETLTVWHGKNNTLKKIHSQGYPHSPGLFYSAMTQRLGLVAQRDEYMVAGMGDGYDPNHFRNAFMTEIVDKMPTYKDPRWLFKQNLHRGCAWFRPGIASPRALNMLAATTQLIFEEAVEGLSMWANIKTRSHNLALAGGGALNKQAVDKISYLWKNIHVPTNPGDPGSCVGAVLAQTKNKINIDNKWHKAV